MRQTSFADMHCSLARSLEMVGDWWSPLILRDLSLGLRRFDELADDLGISRNLLTRRLADLTAHGVIERHAYQQHPPRYDYALTASGRELIPILQALTAWGDRWAHPPGGPPLRFRHTPCGHEFTPTVACSNCGDPIDADLVEPLPGPGGAIAPGTRLVGELLSRRT